MARFSIRHPLLVFDRIHRRSGTIERACVFVNPRAQELELEVGFDFPEHSWIGLHPQDPSAAAAFAAVGRLRLAPGENLVALSLNTDSFHFPDRPFRGRIRFFEPALPELAPRAAARGSERWIELSFERVEDLAPFEGFAAIDLGTSSSTLSLFHIRRDAVRREPWSPTLESGSETLPSAIYLRDFRKFQGRAGGGALVGIDALRAFRSRAPADPRCLQLGSKRLLGLDRVLVADESGAGGFLSPLDLLEALGARVRDRAQSHSQVRALLRRLSVTYPPTWSYHLVNRWRQLFARLGWSEDELDLSLDEASAAGLFYLYNRARDRDRFDVLLQDLLDASEPLEESGQSGRRHRLNLLCFDFGGGTIDLALIRATVDTLPGKLRLRLELEGSDSLAFGGDRVTLAIFRMLKRRIAMAACDPARLRKELGGEAAAANDAELAVDAAPAWLPMAARGELLGETFLLPERGGSPWSLARWDGEGGDGASERLAASREIVARRWQELERRLAEDELESDLEDAVDELFPTRFLSDEEGLVRQEARLHFDWLWQEAEELKKRLFREVQRRHGQRNFPDFELLDNVRAGIRLAGAPHPALKEAVSWHDEPLCERLISVSAGEVLRAIAAPLDAAFAKAAGLAGERRIDRVVLSGQSCRMPMLRWMFSRPRAEGGLGVPPSKIEFDDANAKAAVSKGACLLQVMRETLVGFEVDVADFRARLLADIFYLEVDGRRRIVFLAGAVGDFDYFEECPDPSAFPRHLSIFHQDEETLVGVLHLDPSAGEALPPAPAATGLRSREDLLALRERGERASEAISQALSLGEKERIAWMESSARRGAPERPLLRYYLTRSHRLFAVRDAGGEQRSLHELDPAEPQHFGLPPEENPFSGIH